MRHLVTASLVAAAFAAVLATVPAAPVQAADYSNWTEDLLRQNCEFQAERARQRNSAKDYESWTVVNYEWRQGYSGRLPYCEVLAVCRRSAFVGTDREAEYRSYTSHPDDPWYQPGDPIDAWLSQRTWASIGETERLRCCNDGSLQAVPGC